jgi:hypothetical protein
MDVRALVGVTERGFQSNSSNLVDSFSGVFYIQKSDGQSTSLNLQFRKVGAGAAKARIRRCRCNLVKQS